MNLDNLTDAQIRAKFLELGVPVGPVTGTTRKIMLKKLKSLLESGAKPPTTSGEESDGGRLTPKLKKKTIPPPPKFSSRTPRKKSPSRPTYTSSPPLILPVANSTFIDPLRRLNSRNSNDSADNFLPRFNHRIGNEAFRTSLNASYNSSYDSYDSRNGDGIDSTFSSEFLRRLTSSSKSKDGSINSRKYFDVKESDDEESTPIPNYAKFASGRPSRELSSGKICRQTTSPDSWYRLDSPVSALLLVSFLLFFGAIGVVYINKTSVVSSLTSPRSDVNFELCRHSNSHNCVDIEDFPYVELMFNALLMKLDDEIADVSCSAESLNLTDDEMQNLILSVDKTLHPSIIERNLNNLKIVFDSNSKLNVKRTAEGVQLTSLPRSIHCTLVSATALISYWIVKISVLFLSILAVYLSVRWWIRKEARRKEEAYKLANSIIEIVSTKFAVGGGDNFVPISHVRDQLIPLKDRIRLRRLWDDALSLLESDSRLRKEVQEVEGEHFMVWRWLAANLTNKKKVWQGQAFDTLEGNLNSHVDSPTNCLKIRHMFEAGQEEGDDWVTTVVDAILEKCGSAKILHLVVDRHSPEGLVYMKCGSPADAGVAYRALHGSWFASNLITVKYIREHRYHERFPESVHCSKPLRPSTDSLRSLK